MKYARKDNFVIKPCGSKAAIYEPRGVPFSLKLQYSINTSREAKFRLMGNVGQLEKLA